MKEIAETLIHELNEEARDIDSYCYGLPVTNKDVLYPAIRRYTEAVMEQLMEHIDQGGSIRSFQEEILNKL